MGKKLGDVLLAAKVAGVRIQLSRDTQQPLIMTCETNEQKLAFLMNLFGGETGSRSEELSVLIEADQVRLTKAINRLITTRSIWSEQAFDYGCE